MGAPTQAGTDVSKPDQVWCGDMTFIWTGQQWSCLAVLFDLFSRKPVGCALPSSPDIELTKKSLMLAFKSRSRPRKVMSDSDQSVQYTSLAYRQILSKYGKTQDMSRGGNCRGNSPMERFIRSLISEWLPDVGCRCFEQAKLEINQFIWGYYSRLRQHQNNGGLLPNEAEKRFVINYQAVAKST
jgi:putative transposase